MGKSGRTLFCLRTMQKRYALESDVLILPDARGWLPLERLAGLRHWPAVYALLDAGVPIASPLRLVQVKLHFTAATPYTRSLMHVYTHACTRTYINTRICTYIMAHTHV